MKKHNDQTIHNSPRHVETPKKNPTSSPILVSLGRLGIKISFILLAIIIIFGYVLGLLRYEDPEMAEAVKPGDLVMFYRLQKDYNVSDLAVIEIDGEKHALRVIAKAGDIVDITDRGIVVDGIVQETPYANNLTIAYEKGIRFPVTLEADELFLLSDKRHNRLDSRIIGSVKANKTLGKVIAIYRSRRL